MKNVVAVMLSVVLLTTISCGKKSSSDPNSPDFAPQTTGGPFAGAGVAGGFSFDQSVPSKQQKYFALDFTNASRLSLSSTPGESVRSLFNIPDYSGPSWARWLNDRIHYIVGETWDWEEHTTYTASNSYTPILAQEIFQPFQEIVTLMENTGSGIYRDGKKYSKLYTVNVAGQTFPVKTTRVGIVRIGEGLFTAGQVKSKSAESPVNTLLRIAVFVHESRHSDGNGTNTGFPHAMCTSGTYVNRYSCENNLNGPYAIESLLLESFYESCSDCDSTDKQALASAALDAYNRIQQSTAQVRDDRPERIQ